MAKDNSHIDWTASQGGSPVIHADNYTGGGGGGGALQFTELLNQTFSGQSSVDVDCTGYDQVQLIWEDVTFSSAGGFALRLSADGISFNAGATDYRVNRLDEGANTSGDDGEILLYPKSVTTTGNSGTAMISNMSSSTHQTRCHAFAANEGTTPNAIRHSYFKTARTDTHLRIFELSSFTIDSGRLRVLGVSTARSLSASTPDANIQGVVNQIDVITMSSMTANRDYLLPTTAAVGQIAGISIVDGDPDHEILIKSGAAGDKINNVDHSTNEFTRLFIAGERMVFECIDAAGPHWQVKEDGRIPCVVDAYLSTAPDGETANVWTAPTSAPTAGVWTENKDIGGNFNTSTSVFSPRRNGQFLISFRGRNKDGMSDDNTFGIQVTDGTTRIQELASIRNAGSGGVAARSAAGVLDLTAGTNWTYEYLNSAGAAGLSVTNRYSGISVAEQL